MCCTTVLGCFKCFISFQKWSEMTALLTSCMKYCKKKKIHKTGSYKKGGTSMMADKVKSGSLGRLTKITRMSMSINYWHRQPRQLDCIRRAGPRRGASLLSPSANEAVEGLGKAWGTHSCISKHTHPGIISPASVRQGRQREGGWRGVKDQNREHPWETTWQL